MKIAINGAFFQPRGGGIKEYIYNLILNLSNIGSNNEYVLYVLLDQVEYANEAFKNIRIKAIPYTTRQVVARSLFEKWFWRREEKKEKFDIFHSPFFHAPKLKQAKVVLTVHDLRLCVFPKTYTFKRLIFLKYAVRQSVKRADHIISISDFTKKELIKYYDLSSEKITTIHEAINLSDFSESNIKEDRLEVSVVNKLYGKKYLFSLGHIEPRKNYSSLVEAFKELNKDLEDCYLVIAGKKAQGYAQFQKAIEGLDSIIYLDFVSHEMLLWLYKNATAFVFPSIYEGFGFPPLEAAALGTPSAVANSSCIPEICGDAAVYFNPYDIDEIRKTCREIIINDELRNSLKFKSIENLQRFSWERNAQQTINVYNSLISER